MLLSLNEVRGYDIRASDDTIGRATDCFFDDVLWNVRYLVVDTGWIFGRKVLVAPEAIQGVDIVRGEVSVSLTKKEIEDGPSIGTDLPVSRQAEIVLRAHYGWTNYWEVFPAGLGAAPVSSTLADAREAGDPNLRSAREVEGYHIEATDGEVGHVENFILDVGSWAIGYVVVDTGKWLPGRKVLVAPGWAEGIDWPGRLLWVNLDREAVKNSPPYDPGIPIARNYEVAMYEHYGRKPYWS